MQNLIRFCELFRFKPNAPPLVLVPVNFLGFNLATVISRRSVQCLCFASSTLPECGRDHILIWILMVLSRFREVQEQASVEYGWQRPRPSCGLQQAVHDSGHAARATMQRHPPVRSTSLQWGSQAQHDGCHSLCNLATTNRQVTVLAAAVLPSGESSDFGVRCRWHTSQELTRARRELPRPRPPSYPPSRKGASGSCPAGVVLCP